MATLNETSKTSASALFTGAATSRVGNPASNPEFKRKQELFAWIVIAAIWGIFAISLCLIWAKATRGV